MNAAPRRFAVVGGGSVAWITAHALRRSFAHLEVSVLDIGPETGAARAYWTLPSQRGAHAQLGIGEGDFLRATGATFRLATEHSGWQGGDRRFVHAHAEIGTPIGVTPFYKWILKRTLEGNPERAESWSIAALAARNGRFAQPTTGTEQDLTASFTYGFHVDESSYAAFLRAAAERAGVRRIAGQIADVERHADGRIATLRLVDGAQIPADFFLDCSGTAAQLMGRVDRSPRVDWRHWFPCDRVTSGVSAADPDPPAMTRTTAGEAGWSWRAPLRDATAVGYFHSSAFTSDEAAQLALQRLAPDLREVAVAVTSPGRRQRFWIDNCVAIGAAAVELEPLAGATLHFAQLGLAKFLELFPIDARTSAEAREYDVQMTACAERLRDFTLAHYVSGDARPEPFWAAVRASQLPDSLCAKLDSYRASGRLTIADNETFEETDWAWLLIGAGDWPRTLELRVADAVKALRTAEADALRALIQRLASGMPRHGDYLRRLNARRP